MLDEYHGGINASLDVQDHAVVEWITYHED